LFSSDADIVSDMVEAVDEDGKRKQNTYESASNVVQCHVFDYRMTNYDMKIQWYKKFLDGVLDADAIKS